jgi:(p)ppGpp synthase/HD superfamily hydrolase
LDNLEKTYEHLRELPELEKAIALAAFLHVGQVDLTGKPYIMHPMRVMAGVKAYDAMVVAALHDLIEDTDITLDELKELGFREEIVEAVDAVSKRDGEEYMDYVARAAANPIGIEVKLSDLRDNLDKTRKLPDDERAKKKIKKYKKAMAYIEEVMEKGKEKG